MAHFLTLSEVLKLHGATPLWIQYGYSLEYDIVYYDSEKDELHQDREQSYFTRVKESYRRNWVLWDKMPTEEQFLEKGWKIC